MEKVTIAEVAKKANVSISTVSRVVSNSPLISEKTKKRVSKIIKQLNYVPNSNAQNLINNKSNIIGVVLNLEETDPLSNEFFSEILDSISDYLLSKGYYTLYIHSRTYENNYIQKLVSSKRVDGLIFLRAYEDERIFEYLSDIKFPFSIIGTPKKIKEYFWVDNDNIKAGYNITKELISKGYKNFCFLGGPMSLNVTKFRYEGYKKALSENNLDNKNVLESNFNLEDGYKTVIQFLKENNNIDAIITTDDVLAIAAMNVMKDINNTKIKVTGFNNSFMRKFGNYKFTTIDIDVKKLGIEACSLLISRVNNEHINNNFSIVQTKIVEE